MSKLIRIVWNDPVWSKVIAVAIVAVTGALWARYSESGSKVLTYPVPLWTVVASALAAFLATALVMILWRGSSPYAFAPELKLTSSWVSVADPAARVSFPLKCHFQLRNDSKGAVQVSMLDYEPDKVQARSVPMAVFQIQFGQEWVPSKNPVSKVAVLPGDLVQGWVGLDDRRYNQVQAEALRGHLGTLVLNVNGERKKYNL